MIRYVVSGLAQEDIDQIAIFIAIDSPARVDRYIDRLTRKFETIAAYPELGRRSDYLLPGARVVPISSHLIVYRVKNRRIQILRILHGRQDLFSADFGTK